jgi:hypothetical protein
MDQTTIIKLSATGLAVACLALTIWAPVEAQAALIGIAGTLVGAVWIRRPGDLG